MKIEKLNNNSYRIRKTYKGKTYTVITPYKPTQKEALELMADKMNIVSDTATIHKTFHDCYLAYKDMKSNVVSPATIKAYDSMIRTMPDTFKNKLVTDITKIDVQKAVNDYSEKHAPKTVSNYYGLITVILANFRPDLVLGCTLPQKLKKEPYIPTENDAKRVFNAIKGSDYEIPIKLGAMGLRRSEICALTLDDLDGNTLTINKAKVQGTDKKWYIKTTKTTESTRSIYLPDELVRLIHERGFFTGHPGCITKYLIRTLDDLNIPHFGVHKLRHFYASEAHAAGIPDSYIMQAGGWKSTSVLNAVYKHAMKDKNEDMQKKAAAQISNLF